MLNINIPPTLPAWMIDAIVNKPAEVHRVPAQIPLPEYTPPHQPDESNEEAKCF